MVTLEAVAIVLALSGAGETVLLDFTAPWCEPCRTMAPTVQRLAREGYPIREVSVDREPQLATQFRVTGVPCFIMLANGREVDRVVGACSHARLVQMFAAANQHQAAAQESVRAQSPDVPASRFSLPNPLKLLDRQRDVPASPLDTELAPVPAHPRTAEPAVAAPDPRSLAAQAAVRIRVEDPNGQSVGSGTVVDRHGQEVLAISCAHIFRDSAGSGRIHVDLFRNGQVSTAQGTLISYDLERDVALVSFVPSVDVRPVQIAPAGFRFNRGDQVFSLGCDLGREPSLRNSQITHLDRYLGPPNIEAAGTPTEGRSGGGLFSRDGFLIGICNHADPADDEGIYASLPTIHWALDEVGQRRIYQPNDPPLASVAAASMPPGQRLASTTAQPTASAPETTPAVASQGEAPQSAVTDTEVICIVRSRNNPQAGERVYVLDGPSRDLLDRLASESRQGLAMRQSDTAASGRSAAASSTLPPAPRGPIVRGQSADPH